MRKMRVRQVVLTISLMLTALESLVSCQKATADSTKAAEEQDIYALVIRSQMEEWIREGDKSEAEAKDRRDKAIAHSLNYQIFFVEINGKDPSDEFIKRFTDLPRTIKKASEEIPSKGPHQPIDKSTHRAGIIFSAQHIRWSSEDSVELEGGYYCGGLCAAGTSYVLERKNGKWAIKTSHLNFIS